MLLIITSQKQVRELRLVLTEPLLDKRVCGESESVQRISIAKNKVRVLYCLILNNERPSPLCIERFEGKQTFVLFLCFLLMLGLFCGMVILIELSLKRIFALNFFSVK